jgi:hypothetical protein
VMRSLLRGSSCIFPECDYCECPSGPGGTLTAAECKRSAGQEFPLLLLKNNQYHREVSDEVFGRINALLGGQIPPLSPLRLPKNLWGKEFLNHLVIYQNHDGVEMVQRT